MRRSWEECLRLVVNAERAHVKRGGTVLRDVSPMELFDAAHEDPQGRLPHEPGYGSGGEVVELPARREPQPVVVGDIFAVLRELGARARGL